MQAARTRSCGGGGVGGRNATSRLRIARTSPLAALPKGPRNSLGPRRGPRKRQVAERSDPDIDGAYEEDEITEKSRAIAQSATPLGSYEADLEDVLQCNNLWDVLAPVPSPFNEDNNSSMGFVSNRDRVAISSLFHGSSDSIGATCGGASIFDAQEEICIPISAWAYRAGARKDIHFNPKTVKAAIVTCGGLCPGLNDVVRGIVQTLDQYGVKVSSRPLALAPHTSPPPVGTDPNIRHIAPAFLVSPLPALAPSGGQHSRRSLRFPGILFLREPAHQADLAGGGRHSEKGWNAPRNLQGRC